MGILNTAIRKSEAKLGTTGTSADERKILMNINSRVEDLRVQNVENAKFLRGISQRIEQELEQMKELEENKSIEVFNDSELLESLERVEKSVQNMNNEEVLDAIDKVNMSIQNMDQSGVVSALEKMQDSISKMGSSEVLEAIANVNESIHSMNSDDLKIALAQLAEKVESLNNTDVLEKLNSSNVDVLERLNSTNVDVLEKLNLTNENVLEKLNSTDEKISHLDFSDILNEVRNVEVIVKDINNNAVLNEIGALKALIEQNNSSAVLDEKIAKLSPKDYTESLNGIRESLTVLQTEQEEMRKKIDRISTMPNMIRSVVEQTNSDNLVKIEDKMVEITSRQTRHNERVMKLLNINLWISGLTLVLFIAKVMGML